MTVLEEIEYKAKQLPYSERGHLVHDLLLTLDPPTNDTDVYEKEIKQRIASIESGTAVGIPAEEVFSLIDNKYV